ncbi:MAG TPA: hypothetical protein VGP22_16120 [Albitalea sp.]|jgi:hypothetical protein|nr:hypothetical protein [Albitalea sp.]
MTPSTPRHPARRQALVGLVVLVALVGSVVMVEQGPANPDELKISFEMLRTQVAELLLLDA